MTTTRSVLLAQAEREQAQKLETALLVSDGFVQKLFEADRLQRSYLVTGRAEYLASLRGLLSYLSANAERTANALDAGGPALGQPETHKDLVLRKISRLDELARMKDSGQPTGLIHLAIRQESERMGSFLKGVGDARARVLAALNELHRESLASDHRVMTLNAFTGMTSLLIIVIAFVRLDRLLRAKEALIVSLQTAQERYRLLADRLHLAREDERAAIARNIHDVIGQRLTGIKMDLSLTARRLRSVDERSVSDLRATTELIDEAIRSVQSLAMELRPAILDELGLIPTLQWQVTEFARRTGIRTALEAEAGLPELDDRTQTSLFRIVQEALTNVARHAHAKQAGVSVSVEAGMVTASVKDNGIGFDPALVQDRRAMGLMGMQERARLIEGEFEVHTARGEGTKITARAPLSALNGRECSDYAANSPT